MENGKNILCIKATGLVKDGTVEDENIRAYAYSAVIDTDDGKCIRLALYESGNVHNVMDDNPPEPLLLLQDCFVDTGDKNDCNKNSLLHYISTGANHGSICLVYNNKSLGQLCQNNKESICKYINDTFGCSYDGVEVLPKWARAREGAGEKPVIYDREYYLKMQDCMEKIDALYTRKAEKLREENMKAHPKSLWHARHVDPLDISEKERGGFEVEMRNASSDYPPLCGKTRNELQMELMGTNVPASVRFTVDTGDPDFLKKLPFSDEMMIKALKEHAVKATPGFQDRKKNAMPEKSPEKYTGMER